MAATGGKGALKGVLFGAAIGAASSYLIHKALQKRDSKTRRQTLLNLDKFSVSAPTRGQGVQNFRLSAPDVDAGTMYKKRMNHKEMKALVLKVVAWS